MRKNVNYLHDLNIEALSIWSGNSLGLEKYQILLDIIFLL